MPEADFPKPAAEKAFELGAIFFKPLGQRCPKARIRSCELSKPDVLAVAKLHPFYQKALESLYTVHDRTHVTDPAAFAALAPRIVGVAGTGEASARAAGSGT